jgi:nifR3 family TIM-barrel protein
MKKNIWQKLINKKPFICLAPMAGVTDFPFREILAEIGSPVYKKRGKPDLFFTEFISVEGIWRGSGFGRHYNLPIQYMNQLVFSKKQRPIIVQFFGCRPEQFEYCARLALKLGFDGIDINMGCPDRNVLKQRAGSGLIRNPELAREIVRATIRGCDGKIPVSIKTRLGYNKKDIGYWISDILGEGVSAITIHGRTVKQGYSGEADWKEIGETTKEIKKKFPNIVVVGNGDIKDIEQGKMLSKKYGVDGVMIGRAILKNPWVFSGKENIGLKTRLRVALKHTKIFEKFYGKEKSFSLMKKYYKGYLLGVNGDLFDKKSLMDAKNIEETKRILMSKL